LLIKARKYFRKQKGRRFDFEKLMEFKCFQLYAGMNNICLANVIYPAVTGPWIILIVVGAYTGIRLFDTFPLPMYAFFECMTFDSFLFIGMKSHRFFFIGRMLRRMHLIIVKTYHRS